MSASDPLPFSPQNVKNLVRLRGAIDEACNDDWPTTSAEEVFAQLRAHHAERIKAETGTDKGRF